MLWCVEQLDAESARGFGELRRGQPAISHQGDHPVYAVAKPLDEAHIREYLDNNRIAREALVHDVVERDRAGQTTGAGDFHPVSEQEQAYAIALDAVIAVRNSINDQFARSFHRVL